MNDDDLFALIIGALLIAILGLGAFLWVTSVPISTSTVMREVKRERVNLVFLYESGEPFGSPKYRMNNLEQLEWDVLVWNNNTGNVTLVLAEYVQPPNIVWNYLNQTLAPGDRLLVTFAIIDVLREVNFVVYGIMEVPE